MFLRLLTSAAALILALTPTGAVRAQALIVAGEEIADARLMTAAKAEGKITVYGGRPTESIRPVIDAFVTDSGIQLDYIRLSTAAMYDRVIAEFTAGRLNADYADMSDLALIADWVKRGVLAKHKVPWDARIPAEIKHPDGYWYYISRSIYVIGINAAEVAEKDYPRSYADTLHPKWKGKVGTQTMDSGGSAATLHAFLRVKLGEDAWKRLAQNEPRIYPNSAPELTDLVRGRIPLAYIDAGSIVTQLQNGAPLKMVFPTEGLASYGVFGNVTSSAPHPNAARVWVNYLVSKRGSSEMSKSASYGTHPDATPPSVPGFAFPAPTQVWTIAPDSWETTRQSWVEEWKRTLLKN